VLGISGKFEFLASFDLGFELNLSQNLNRARFMARIPAHSSEADRNTLKETLALVTTVYELRCQIFAFTLAVFRIHLNMWGRALLFGHCGQVGWMAHIPNAPFDFAEPAHAPSQSLTQRESSSDGSGAGLGEMRVNDAHSQRLR